MQARTCDFATRPAIVPIILSEHKKKITQAVIAALCRSRVETGIAEPVLAELLARALERFTNGVHFDAGKLWDALRLDERCSPEDVRLISADLRHRLHEIGISITGVDLVALEDTEPNRMRLAKLLVDHRVITTEQLERAREAQAVFGGSIGQNLLELRLVSEAQLLHVASLQTNTPAVAHRQLLEAPAEVAKLLPRSIAARYGAFAFSLKNGVLNVAMVDPHDVSARKAIADATALEVRTFLSLEPHVAQAIKEYYGVPESLAGGDYPKMRTLGSEMLSATCSPDVLELAVSFLLRTTEVAACLMTKKDKAGLIAFAGHGVNSPATEEIAMSIADSTLFRTLECSGRAIGSARLADRQDRKMLRALGVSRDTEVFAAAIEYQGRKVGCVLAGGPRIEASAGTIEDVAARIAMAFDFLRAKRRLIS